MGKDWIGLSGEPKLPSLSLRKSRDSGSNPKEPDIGCLWSPKEQLIDGFFVPPSDPRKLNQLLRKQAIDTAGSNWFDMPAPAVTDELKKDLQLLKVIKQLLNMFRGQAEKEFRVEVEAIGHTIHKNLVRLLGYCNEGVHRLLVYANNGNLEQWLYGAMHQHGLAYLHEAIEPKVVHRDIKSSSILIDDKFNPKIFDFGLAKLLGAGKSHVSTRVMVSAFVLLETITGRDPVDHSRPSPEVNLVDWLKMMMVGSRRAEEVVDPNIETRPSTSALKRAPLTTLQSGSGEKATNESGRADDRIGGVSTASKRIIYEEKSRTGTPKPRIKKKFSLQKRARSKT